MQNPLGLWRHTVPFSKIIDKRFRLSDVKEIILVTFLVVSVLHFTFQFAI